MFRSSAVATALSLALACAGLSFVSGCGNSQDELDHAAESGIAKADQDRAKAEGLKDPAKAVAALSTVQVEYDNLAAQPGLSPQMQIIVRGRQAQFRMERIMAMVAELHGKELEITRTIDDIEQLALQVAGAESRVEAIKSYDPSPEIAKLKAQEADIQGAADKPAWNAGSPTLAKVQAEIDSLTAEIAANRADTEQQQQNRLAKINDAEKYSRQSEGESAGPAQVKDITTASEDRRDAAIADAKIQQNGLALIQLQSNLQKAQGQKTVLNAGVAAIEAQIKALDSSWASTQQQMQAQQKVQQNLIVGGDSGALANITGRSEDLARDYQAAAVLRDKVVTELNAVINQFGQAVKEADLLRHALVQNVHDNAGDPDVAVWQQTEETLNPVYYSLQEAAAQEASASVAAARTRIDVLINQMFDGHEVAPGQTTEQFKLLNLPAAGQPAKIPGLTAVLDRDKTGIDMPKALTDLPRIDPDRLKTDEDAVSKLFAQAVKTYQQKLAATDAGAARQERKNLALAGQAATDRHWADFATAIGDQATADNCLKDAGDAQSQIVELTAGATAAAPLGIPRTRDVTR